MKKLSWRETAELIGIIAILASLMFVALQLHQQEELLQIEIRNYLVSSQLELHASIAEHADVWAKGNAGEALEPAEQAAYMELLVALNDWYFHTRLVLSEIAPSEEGQLFVLYGGFLADNPGAYAAWIQRETKLDDYRTSLRSNSNPIFADSAVANDWLETIQSTVEAIRSSKSD